MTKQKMTELLQKKESELWTDLARLKYQYVTNHFPFGYGFSKAELTGYTRNDYELNALLTAWYEVAELLNDMGIEATHNATAFEYQDLHYQWLNGKTE